MTEIERAFARALLGSEPRTVAEVEPDAELTPETQELRDLVRSLFKPNN